ncbi:MAG: Rap1a/Tai family immunity protein [Rhodanobacteraceae bacterium]
MKKPMFACAVALALAVAAMLASAPTAIAQTSAPNPTISTSALYFSLKQQLVDWQNPAAAERDLNLWSDAEAVGYVGGVLATLSLNADYPPAHGVEICIPTNASISASAVDRIVVKFIDAHPTAYGQAPITVVSEALMQAFPCAK